MHDCTMEESRDGKRINISLSESFEDEDGVRKRKCRRVHFAPVLSEADVCVQIKLIPLKSEEERRNMFYSQNERSKLMRSIQSIIIDITEEDNYYYQRGIMNHRVDKCGYVPIICRAFQSCCASGDKLTAEELYFLKYHLTKTDSRRGLEKYIVASLGERRRRSTIRAVIDQYSAAMANHGHVSKDVQATITKTYSDRTAAFKRFAVLKGHMDELATKVEVDVVPVQSISTSLIDNWWSFWT